MRRKKFTQAETKNIEKALNSIYESLRVIEKINKPRYAAHTAKKKTKLTSGLPPKYEEMAEISNQMMTLLIVMQLVICMVGKFSPEEYAEELESLVSKERLPIVGFLKSGLAETILSDKELFILKLRYGIGSTPHTLAGIGRKFELSRERIRQIQNAAFKKIDEFGEINKSAS